MGLSEGERISMIRSAVLIQYTRVTDRQTDGRNWRGIYGLQLYAVARKNQQKLLILGPFNTVKYTWCGHTSLHQEMRTVEHKPDAAIDLDESSVNHKKSILLFLIFVSFPLNSLMVLEETQSSVSMSASVDNPPRKEIFL